MFAPLKKGTLFILSGSISEPDKKHLFVILNDPHGDPEQCLLASFSSWRDDIYCDPTCRLQGGRKEHDFLVVESFVRYQKLQLEPATKLVAGVAVKVMQPSFPVKAPVFERICQGVFDSPFVKPRFRTFLQQARDAGC